MKLIAANYTPSDRWLSGRDDRLHCRIKDAHIEPTQFSHRLRELVRSFVRIEDVQASGQIAGMPAVHFVLLTFGQHAQFSLPSAILERVCGHKEPACFLVSKWRMPLPPGSRSLDSVFRSTLRWAKRHEQ